MKSFSLAAALFFSLIVGNSSPASAQSLGFTMPGAVQPDYSKSKWVKGLDQAVLSGYRHSTITHITFHHEGFADGDRNKFSARQPGRLRQSLAERARNIHNFHVQSGLGMIAYNYVIGVDGSVAQGRPLDYAPATFTKHPGTGQIADFTGHFAVVVLGDFGVEELRAEVRLGLVKAMSAAQRHFRVPTANIEPHKDHVAHNGRFGTMCPGENMYKQKDLLANMTLAVSLQTELKQRGCYAAKVDGAFGPSSQSALQELARAAPSLGKLAVTDDTLWALIDTPQARCR